MSVDVIKYQNIFKSSSVYLVGLLSIFLVDISVSAYYPDGDIANWALIKSILYIGAPISLLGIQHALIRSPELINRVHTFALMQCVFGSTLVGCIFSYFYNLDWYVPVLILMPFVIVSFLYGISRAEIKIIRAQVYLHGWKILLCGCLLALIRYLDYLPEIYWILFVALIAFSVFALLLDWYHGAGRKIHFNLSDLKLFTGLYRTGFAFALTMIVLGVTLYIEQALLNYEGKIKESATLFRHTSAVLPVMLLFNGYINFILGPLLRKYRKIIINKWHSHYILLVIGIFFVGLIGVSVGYSVFRFLYSDAESFNLWLAIGLALVGSIRTLFIFPSSVIAVFASTKDLYRFVLLNMIGLIVYIVIYFVVSRITDNYLLAVIVGSLINWVTRVGNAFKIAKITIAEIERSR